MSEKIFHYIHHAAFWLDAEGKRALFDPFLDGNPEHLRAQDIDADWIFVSHAHADHLGSAFEIAQRTGATIISTAEICGLADQAGCASHAMHIGGTHEFAFGKVRIAPAFHGSGIAGGHACGFIVNYFGIRLYYAADTGLIGAMKWLRYVAPFDVAVLPIGDNYTMGPKDAAIAAAWLGASVVIPVHYNTWPVIAQDPKAFEETVEKEFDIRVQIVEPGKSVHLS